MMDQHLQQFAQQLAIWTEEIIEHGRTPFRRVDIYPKIDTKQGPIEPPLVFWINRQSMMAGGILLLPKDNLEAELSRGRDCASALGLRHFVTWETDRVRIWQVEKDATKEQQSFPLSSPTSPETFHYLLADLLEALKLLAILGAIPATDLSPYYFNNLFQITLQQALPPLTEAYRSQRSEIEGHSTEDADTCAAEANRLLLLQVLSLLWFNKFPDAILPEKMDRAIELSLRALPDFLRSPLSLKTTIKPPPLPLETAVCFHHLLLRLRQLSWNQPAERGKESIHRLSTYWFQGTTEKRETVAIHLYPETPPLNSVTTTLLSHSPSFLATTALLADMTDCPQCKLFYGNLFELDQDSLLNQPVLGRLLNTRGIGSSERREYTTRLRTAWPNRRLKIKTGQSFWRWELVHLLGISHVGQSLSLELPIDLLTGAKNQLAWSLLCEVSNFQQIRQLSNGNIQFDILRCKKTGESFPLQLEDEVREITPIVDPDCFKSQLLLALILPANIYKLLENELIWPDSNGIPDEHLSGWEVYRQSRLYKWFQYILQSEATQFDSENETPLETTHFCIPYPEPLLLNELVDFGLADSKNSQPLSIDRFLADLLSCPAVENIKLTGIVKNPKVVTSEIHSEKKLKETIEQQLATHGIPNFPEQYLYFLDQPEMCHYSMTPPLAIKSNFLGQFELEDATGRIIVGYGEELKQILLFCSELGKTEIDLPSDRYQLEQLLQHYQKDLETLYKYLNNLCYSQVKKTESARKVVKSTWRKLNLPKPSWFNN